MTLADFFLAKRPDVGAQWDVQKNTVRPETLKPGSRERVWWKCEKGHEWQASVDSRIHAGRSCPYCANQAIIPGENDMASMMPELVPLWHPERNGGFSPTEVSPGSRQKVWWQCSRGHSWRAAVYSVSAGAGCPYCSGRNAIPGETDLATTHPHLRKFWSGRNKLTPEQVTVWSHRKVWWICEKGHEWEAMIGSVVSQGCGCPYCAGKKAIPGENDLATLFPELMQQWDWEKNSGVDPGEILPSSHERVWWKCELGHSYQAVVFSRTREKATGCPYCTGRKVLPGFNDLATLKPEVAEQWYQPLNEPLNPADVTLGSNKKVWWQCREGHVWQAFVYARTKSNGTGCPVCAGTARKSNI